MRHFSFILLGIWLSGQAVLDLGNWHFYSARMLLSGIALAAGITMLLSVISERVSQIGLLLLSIWLIINGIVSIFELDLQHSAQALAILAIVSGILLMMRK